MDSSSSSSLHLKYISSQEAANIDVDLVSDDQCFSMDQLMELAGLSVAHAIHHDISLFSSSPPPTSNILFVTGPGNNGGDGLVAARHLQQMGHKTFIFFPSSSPPSSPLLHRMRQQALAAGCVFFLGSLPSPLPTFHLVVDALFGFTFRPPVRPLYVEAIKTLRSLKCPMLSVDVPSGWEVDKEKQENEEELIRPDAVISLTAPKICMKNFTGRHYLGGRFVTKHIQDKYGLVVPPYEGLSQVYRLK